MRFYFSIATLSPLLVLLLGTGCSIQSTRYAADDDPSDFNENAGGQDSPPGDDDDDYGDDDDDAAGDDDDAAEAPPSGLENLVVGTRPVDESAEFHYQGCLGVSFANPYADHSVEVSLWAADGASIELIATPISPLELEVCPVSPLLPETAYEASVTWGSDPDGTDPYDHRSFSWNFETSELGIALGECPSGRFVLDPRSFSLASPSDLPEDLLSTLGAGRVLIEFGEGLVGEEYYDGDPSLPTLLNPSAVTFASATETSTDGAYDMGLCAEAMPAPEVSAPLWGDPELDTDAFDLRLPVFGDAPIVWDLELRATMSPDGSYLGGVEAEGLFDSRVLDAFSEADPGTNCAFWAEAWGVECTACPTGEPLCIEVVLRDGTAYRSEDLPALDSADSFDPRDPDSECGELSGCGCSAAPLPSEAPMALLLLPLLGLRRRRGEGLR